MLPPYKVRKGVCFVASKKKKESGSGGLGEMVRRGLQKLARDPRAQRTANVHSVLPKKGLVVWCNASVVDKGGERSRKRSRGQKPWLLFF